MKSPTKPYVLSFAELMEEKLSRNRHKGDRDGWLSCPLPRLMHLLLAEVLELEEVTRGGVAASASEVALECADVANFAMMIADKCGGLPAPTNEN